MQFTDNKAAESALPERPHQRKKFPDILKGFAVILVVLGHCIQEGSGEDFSVRSLYFYDKLYQFIYSFHMPLFMAVSGYLCRESMSRAVTRPERITMLKKRAVRLLAPIFLWTGADMARSFVTAPEPLPFEPGEFLLSFFRAALLNLWFLWAVFWCFLIVYIIHYHFHDSILLYMAGFISMFLLPDGLGLGAYKFLLPFFVAAFYAHDFLNTHNCAALREPRFWKVLSAGAVFGILFLFFDENSMIYLSGYRITGKDVLLQLRIDFYRALTGFAGVAFFTLLWQYILRKTEGKLKFRILTELGKNSMGIYILSGYILLLFVRRIPSITEPSYLLNIAETLVILPLTLFITKAAGNVPFLCLFVGQTSKKSAASS